MKNSDREALIKMAAAWEERAIEADRQEKAKT
jgi:hypothetical protein